VAFLSDLEENLLDETNCTATNGCGVHIHSGLGCEDKDAQGGHFYNDTIKVDPWLVERYTSDGMGKAVIGAYLDIGSSDVDGHAFVGKSLWDVDRALRIVKYAATPHLAFLWFRQYMHKMVAALVVVC
jgi:hypothetical protein